MRAACCRPSGELRIEVTRSNCMPPSWRLTTGRELAACYPFERHSRLASRRPERRQQHLEFRVGAACDGQFATSKPSVRQQGALAVFPYADEKIAAAMAPPHPALRRHRLQHAV